MKQIDHLQDTIAAISTAPGQGAIGIVRLSGSEALAIADRIFRGRDGLAVSACTSHTVHYGQVVDPFSIPPGAGAAPEAVDEVLLTVMRGPRTYTREDVVELNCHGGPVSLRAVLGLVLRCGARLAEPGEFTRRAFLNGRIDLTQAEAVLDMIRARTETFLRVSAHQLRGELTTELAAIREGLLRVYTQLEAVVNFPEDELSGPRGGVSGTAAASRFAEIEGAAARVDRLLAGSEQGRILREGVRIAICGRPNVGKSSLLNCLLMQPRAIVSPLAGTTRDTIEEAAQIDGIPFQLIDTAGILEPRDLIEEEAVRRSHESMLGADLVLYVLDATQGITEEDVRLTQLLAAQPVMVVLNKCDLTAAPGDTMPAEFLAGRPRLRISALHKTGLEDLRQEMVRLACHGQVACGDGGVMVTNLRHVQALERCRDSLQQALAHARAGLSEEFVSEEIRSAVAALDQITGRDVDADLLDQIFADFCVGK